VPNLSYHHNGLRYGGNAVQTRRRLSLTLYCGIDLHSNNHVLVVIEDNDKRLLEHLVPNEFDAKIAVLKSLMSREGNDREDQVLRFAPTPRATRLAVET